MKLLDVTLKCIVPGFGLSWLSGKIGSYTADKIFDGEVEKRVGGLASEVLSQGAALHLVTKYYKPHNFFSVSMVISSIFLSCMHKNPNRELSSETIRRSETQEKLRQLGTDIQRLMLASGLAMGGYFLKQNKPISALIGGAYLSGMFTRYYRITDPKTA